MKSKFLFDHIPKTAGTSLDDAFAKLFPKYSKPENIANLYRATISQSDHDFVGGHFIYLPGDILSPLHYHCAVLRDPVQRFISQYFFNRQMGEILLTRRELSDIRLTDPQVLTSLRCSIDEYVTFDGLIKDSYSNVQALHFAARIAIAPSELNDKDLTDAAIASMEGYDLVGSMKNLQGFVDAIARDFDLDTVALHQLNVTRKDPLRRQLKLNTLEVLKQANSVDYKILHWASQRFGWESGSLPKLNNDTVERVVLPELSTPETDSNTSGGDHVEAMDSGDKSISIISPTLKFLYQAALQEKLTPHPSLLKKISERLPAVICRGEKSGTMVVAAGENILIDFDIDATVIEPNLTIGLSIHDREGRLVYGVNSFLLKKTISIDKPGNYRARIRLANPLNFGVYTLSLSLHKGRNHTDGNYHWFDNAAAFAVAPDDENFFEGLVDCRAEIGLLQ